MKESVTLKFNLSKKALTSILYLMDSELTDEMWEKMVSVDENTETNLLSNVSTKQFEMLLASLLLMKVTPQREESIWGKLIREKQEQVKNKNNEM